MSEEYTEIVCIVDRSGSMDAIRDDAIGGFNAFLEGQKQVDGKAILTHVQFDNEYEVVCKGNDLKDAKPYTRATYVPRGSTALNDAIGKTIRDVENRREKDEVSGKVIVSILTDGYENASREYTNEQIKTIIEKKKTDGWEFVFVTAGIDEFKANAIGNGYGIKTSNIMSVPHSGDGIMRAYNSLSYACSSYRQSGNTSDWKMQ